VRGRAKRLMLVFTDCQGRVIGNNSPTTIEEADADDNLESVVPDLITSPSKDGSNLKIPNFNFTK
jgi:hypothetical protein